MLFVSRNLVVKGRECILAGGVLDGVDYGNRCDFVVLSHKKEVVLRKSPLEVGLRGDIIETKSLATPLASVRIDEGF